MYPTSRRLRVGAHRLAWARRPTVRPSLPIRQPDRKERPMSAVATVPQRWSIDRRSAWFLVVAAALGAAVALSASTLFGSNPARPAAPASSVAQPAAVAHAETTGTIGSLRPLSDATFQVAVEEGVPAQYRSGVIFNYPGGAVQVGSSTGSGETVQARYA